MKDCLFIKDIKASFNPKICHRNLSIKFDINFLEKLIKFKNQKNRKNRRKCSQIILKKYINVLNNNIIKRQDTRMIEIGLIKISMKNHSHLIDFKVQIQIVLSLK